LEYRCLFKNIFSVTYVGLHKTAVFNLENQSEGFGKADGDRKPTAFVVASYILGQVNYSLVLSGLNIIQREDTSGGSIFFCNNVRVKPCSILSRQL
jgi:hypothetical protein